MKYIFDKISRETSKLTTRVYSTSFSLGIRLLGRDYRYPVYGIYGFVRFADEIVDTFHEYNKTDLFYSFKDETYKAIDNGISLNPILNSFQHVVNEYKIDRKLIDQFLYSMEMDLTNKDYDRDGFDKYVLGSAEVVGLMCLKIFCDGEEEEYSRLKPLAMKLGAAYQKINFLRDLKADYQHLGRQYFPETDLENFSDEEKKKLEKEIDDDFKEGYSGIPELSRKVRLGVYISYIYYYSLFRKIRQTPASVIMNRRIRVPDWKKYWIFLVSYLKFKLRLI